MRLSCADYRLGAQDVLLVRRGRQQRVRFAADAAPELTSDAPLLVELRTRSSGRVRCTVHALTDGGVSRESAAAVTSRQPNGAQLRPLFSQTAPVSTESRPLPAEPQSAVQNRPLVPETAGETKPLFPETGQSRPLFQPANAVGKPLFVEQRPAGVFENRPLFSAGSPVNAVSKPLFAEQKPVLAQSRPLFPAGSPVLTETKPLLGSLAAITSENKPLFLSTGPARNASDSEKQAPEAKTPQAGSTSNVRLGNSEDMEPENEYSSKLQKASLNSEICGKVLKNTRIVGGNLAQEQAYPWLVSRQLCTIPLPLK